MMSKIKSFGKCYKLFAVAVAIMLLGLMIPHGVNAVAADNTANGKAAKEVTAEQNAMHYGSIYSEYAPTATISGLKSWDIIVYEDGEYDEDESLYNQTDDPFEFEYAFIPDGAYVGIDPDYRLHIKYTLTVFGTHNYDVYVQANAKPGFEAYAWYIDLPDGDYVILPDDVDADDQGAYQIKGDVFDPDDDVAACCEFIGTVDVNLKTTEGHDHYNWKYYVDGELNADEPAYAEEEWYYWEDTQLSIDKDGNLISTFTDPIIRYTETEQLTAVPKDGYKLESWTIDGKEYKVGEAVDVMTVQFQQTPFSIQANYKAMNVAQTGDNQALPFIIIGLVVVALACGGYAIYRFVIKKK